jgi:hypothetical protein
LQRRLAAEPGRPLVLFLGTSRILYGVRPDVMMADTANHQPAPLVFNFGEPGIGFIHDLLYLNRLLSRGIRPHYLFVEVWPIHLSTAGETTELARIAGRPLEWSDLVVLRPFTHQLPLFYARWLRERLAPGYVHRSFVLRSWPWNEIGFAPPASPSVMLDGDDFGWQAISAIPEGPAKDQAIADQQGPHREHHFANWQQSQLEEQALRQLLATCRFQGINVSMVFMPERSEYQRWYPPVMVAETTRTFEQLSREFAVPWIDARNWMPDTALFDVVHLDGQGATSFSRRFACEILAPQLADQLAQEGPAPWEETSQ